MIQARIEAAIKRRSKKTGFDFSDAPDIRKSSPYHLLTGGRSTWTAEIQSNSWGIRAVPGSARAASVAERRYSRGSRPQSLALSIRL